MPLPVNGSRRQPGAAPLFGDKALLWVSNNPEYLLYGDPLPEIGPEMFDGGSTTVHVNVFVAPNVQPDPWDKVNFAATEEIISRIEEVEPGYTGGLGTSSRGRRWSPPFITYPDCIGTISTRSEFEPNGRYYGYNSGGDIGESAVSAMLQRTIYACPEPLIARRLQQQADGDERANPAHLLGRWVGDRHCLAEARAQFVQDEGMIIERI